MTKEAKKGETKLRMMMKSDLNHDKQNWSFFFLFFIQLVVRCVVVCGLALKGKRKGEGKFEIVNGPIEHRLRHQLHIQAIVLINHYHC
jgi:hypothetical protein